LPASGCSDGVGQQQDSLAGDLHLHPRIDEALEPFGAVAPKDVGKALRVGLQEFHAAFLNGDLPGVPQGRREQY
jgi:hypothetical protein